MSRIITITLLSGCLLISGLLLSSFEVSAQDKPLLSEAIRNMIDSKGVDAATKYFEKDYAENKNNYQVDQPGIIELGTNYARAGNPLAMQAVFAIGVPYINDMALAAATAKAEQQQAVLNEAKKAKKEADVRNKEHAKEVEQANVKQAAEKQIADDERAARYEAQTSKAPAAYIAEAFAAKDVSTALNAALGSDSHTPSDAIKLETPPVVDPGLSVPVTVSSTLPNVESIVIIASANQNPLVSTYQLSSLSEAFISTRIIFGKAGKGLVLAVVKSDGKLYSATKEVNTAEGCYVSGRGSKFRAAMKIKSKSKNGVTTVKTVMKHPMESGLCKDRQTGKIIPAHHITEVTAEHNGNVVMSANYSSAISTDPYLSFKFKGGASGEKVRISWIDNRGEGYSQEAAIR